MADNQLSLTVLIILLVSLVSVWLYDRRCRHKISRLKQGIEQTRKELKEFKRYGRKKRTRGQEGPPIDHENSHEYDERLWLKQRKSSLKLQIWECKRFLKFAPFLYLIIFMLALINLTTFGDFGGPRVQIVDNSTNGVPGENERLIYELISTIKNLEVKVEQLEGGTISPRSALDSSSAIGQSLMLIAAAIIIFLLFYLGREAPSDPSTLTTLANVATIITTGIAVISLILNLSSNIWEAYKSFGDDSCAKQSQDCVSLTPEPIPSPILLEPRIVDVDNSRSFYYEYDCCETCQTPQPVSETPQPTINACE